MRLLGFNIGRRQKAAVPVTTLPADLSGGGGWYPLVRESFPGAWQRNVKLDRTDVFQNVYLFRCLSLMSSDIAKMNLRLVQLRNSVWVETYSPAFSPVIEMPNHFQNRIQFFESWVLSKLSNGNAYILKERDGRGLVVGMYVLDPYRVRPLIATNGDIYYQLSADNLAGISEQSAVPARDIIHDRWNCLFHPLVGLSPIYAAALAASQGVRIQEHSAAFFANGSNPGGVLTAPGRISDDTARRLKQDWEEKFTGGNVGRIAVLGDGLSYSAMSVTALDSQLVEQLKWSGEAVCAAFGVPPYKAGAAPAPTHNNIEALGQQYYEDCLQIHIESIEECLDRGLALPQYYGIEFDLDGLLRMDSATKMKTISDGVGAGVLTPNEGRQKLNYAPVTGGDTPYLQQQNFSLAALNKRDTSADPFGKVPAPAASVPSPTTTQEQPPPPKDAGDIGEFLVALTKRFNSEQPLAGD